MTNTPAPLRVGLWLAAFVLQTVGARASPDAGATCEPVPDTDQSRRVNSAYLVNTDPNSLRDVLGMCPGHVSERSPDCYLSASWVPDAYASRDGVLGSFWANAGCTPAMAFHVKDKQLNGAQGLVIAGAPAATAARIRDALTRDPNGTLTWAAAIADEASPQDTAPPPDEATCLVSFDFGIAPTKAVQVTSAAIASFYVHWCPSGACGVLDDGAKFWPPDGLGVARSPCIETWRTRQPVFAAEPRPIERFSFSRGVLYGDDLTAFGTGCAASQAVDVDLASVPGFDPTGGPPPWLRSQQCRDPNGASPPAEPPPDFRLVPPALDAALRAQSVTWSQNVRNAPTWLLEGVPNGILADANAAPTSSTSLSQNRLLASYLLRTRAEVALSATDQTSWVVVPELLGSLDQHLTFTKRSALGRFEIGAAQPSSGPTYAAVDPSGRRLVSQAFALGSDADLTVEALESFDFKKPIWPPVADAFDVSSKYGTRWTSNAGSPDCFATTGFTSPSEPFQRLSYPAGSGADAEIAEEMCPNALDGWLTRTRAAREQPDTGICNAATQATDPTKQLDSVVEAISRCAADAGCPDAGPSSAAACLRSGCDPTVPGTCADNPACATFFNHLAGPLQCEQECVARNFVAHTEAILPPPDHWEDVLDGDALRWIPMVGLLRTTGKGATTVSDGGTSESPTPQTLTSEMTTGDDFTGGAHQTMDWNWVVDPADPEAIDPAYRGIAVRSGRFVGIENELETGIPAGAWTAHARISAMDEFNTHGLPFAYFLQSKDDAEHLGEIWPSDFCQLFGIDRGSAPGQGNHPSIPSASCTPCLSCKSGAPDGDRSGCAFEHTYWRSHLGRGLFSPVTPETTDQGSDTAAMATDPAWPPCDSSPSDAGPVPALSLGLEDWQACPHRVSFLGRPIVDCGHGDECGGPSRLEIHPPHLVAMDLHGMSLPGGAQCVAAAPCAGAIATDGCTSGTVTAIFGWANVTTGRHFEFDLWPPARPSPDSKLCVIGHQHDESPLAGDTAFLSNNVPTSATPIGDLGFNVEQDRQHGHDGQACPLPDVDYAKLACTPVPLSNPNHVHCVYDDPAAESSPNCTPSAPVSDPLWTFSNPRMTPWFVTSRFEARFFLGWGNNPANCPVCQKGSDSCQDLFAASH